MKSLATPILLMALAGASAAQAQQYRPFRAGLTYQLSESATPGDTLHVLRLGAATRAGADSVFAFGARTSRSIPRPTTTPCGEFVLRADNLFGASLTVRPGAEYVLTAASGRALTLRPRAAVGQVWAATAGGLTARVTGRAAGLVLGRTDSLATIAFSDGATLTLSKTYGFVAGPTLGAYLNPRLPRRAVALTALPEAGLGTALTGALAAYDFQPGDVFLRRTLVFGAVAPCGSTSWTRDSISSRTATAGGDTVRYQIRRQELRLSNCAPPYLGAARLVSFVVTAHPYDQQSELTDYWDGTGTNSRSSILHLPARRTADFNNRPVQPHMGLLTCSAPVPADTINLMDSAVLDQSHYRWTAPGLGETHSYFPNFATEETWLMGYQKGSETWGQLTPFHRLLPARASRAAASTAAFPSPFAQELTVAFELARPQAVAAQLRDALGRVVLAQEAAALAAGPQRLTLGTATLPAGLYTLHLRFAGEARSEVLKVVKQ